MEDARKKELLFPHEKVRDEQNKLLLLTNASIENKRNLIVHAPTGLGKTAATLSPALMQAIKKDLTILFLTSRHTQHKIAIDTLKEIKKNYNVDTSCVSVIGKKHMCLQPVSGMQNSDFIDYCKKLREDKKCEYYQNARSSQSKFTVRASSSLKILNDLSPLTSEQVIDECSKDKLCPYELSIGMAQKAKVIITDYYYLFHPDIGEGFLKKIGKEIENLIVIVDEAHNLPNRLKDLASEYLSSVTLMRATKEAKKFGYGIIARKLTKILNTLDSLSKSLGYNQERLVAKKEFIDKLDEDYELLIEELENAAKEIRELQKQSYLGSISSFLTKWQGLDTGFARILGKKKGLREDYITLSYRCLDASIVSRDIIKNTRSTILMSGTLLPTQMYKELLGVEDCQEVVFKDPFPKENRLNLIVPKTTTKFSARSDAQFEQIGRELTEMVNLIPGNCAVFFPSYFILEKVKEIFNPNKTMFTESPQLNKQEREEFLENFKKYKNSGAVLLAVASGSFGEGIDLPGDLLKAVIVVGLPLSAPDLETKSLIEYFDKKFGKGWDYGYLFPAFNKALQNAGRCIRSETDKGVIIFLDERFNWPNYRRCFPDDWDIEVSLDYKKFISEFFNGSSKNK